jgi:hypothetical protein
MNTPRKFYRIFSFGPGRLELFNTIEIDNQMVNANWFEAESEADEWIRTHMQDVNDNPPIVLTVLPVWSVKTK